MPRMTTKLNLQADRPGVYDGLSAHFSGNGFPGMDSQPKPLAQRLGWFALVWMMSVIALAIVAWLIRIVLL